MALTSPTPAERKEIEKNLCHNPIALEHQYDAFLQFYQSVVCTARRGDHLVQINQPAFSSHTELLVAVDKLRAAPTEPRVNLINYIFPAQSQEEKERGIQAIAKAAFMVDCAVKDKYSDSFRVGTYAPVKWQNNETLVGFLNRAFPILSSSSFHKFPHKRRLKAWKLKKRYDITILPTNDLVEHLLFDREARTIRIFHQTAFLKAQLRHSATKRYNAGFEDSIKAGTLPPQLLFETLRSTYDILFPVEDKKCHRFVKKLTTRYHFDPDFAIFGGNIRKDFPADLQYQYWGERLRLIGEIVTNPPPANNLIAWIERHTHERNALTVALVGLFLAAFFGFLASAIGAAQLAVSVLAWKRPVQGASGSQCGP